MPHTLPPAPTQSDRLVMDIASRSTSVTGHAARPRRNRVTRISLPIRNKFWSMSSRLRTNLRAEPRVVASLEHELHPTGTTGGQTA